MVTTLLFGLDHTLLDNEMGTFLPPYFQLLSAHLTRFVAPEKLMPQLLAAMQAMIANADPTRTLREVFDEQFYAPLGLDRDTLTAAIDAFYREKFPTLESVTEQRPEAREVMEWAFGAGLQVGIATAPLFPLAAVDERLRWAGVGPSEFEYAIVPSYETMHFAKPRPEYYAELIAKLGKRPDQVLMVGNDWLDDIVPAAAVGLHTFWIDAPGARPPTNGAPPDGRGTPADFLRWARDERCLESLTPRPATPPGLIAQLAGNLAAFFTAFKNVPDRKRRPMEGEWSLTEVICHLRDVEAEVNLPRLQRLAAETEPFVPAADTDPWAITRDYQSQDCEPALAQFARARQATLDFVRSLPPGVWSRPARHAILGRTTSTELVSFMVEHDRIHLEQIKALS